MLTGDKRFVIRLNNEQKILLTGVVKKVQLDLSLHTFYMYIRFLPLFCFRVSLALGSASAQFSDRTPSFCRLPTTHSSVHSYSKTVRPSSGLPPPSVAKPKQSKILKTLSRKRQLAKTHAGYRLQPHSAEQSGASICNFPMPSFK